MTAGTLSAAPKPPSLGSAVCSASSASSSALLLSFVIHPAWRGYDYFVYNEEVIIIEPHSHKIVEVIVVS